MNTQLISALLTTVPLAGCVTNDAMPPPQASQLDALVDDPESRTADVEDTLRTLSALAELTLSEPQFSDGHITVIATLPRTAAEVLGASPELLLEIRLFESGWVLAGTGRAVLSLRQRTRLYASDRSIIAGDPDLLDSLHHEDPWQITIRVSPSTESEPQWSPFYFASLNWGQRLDLVMSGPSTRHMRHSP